MGASVPTSMELDMKNIVLSVKRGRFRSDDPGSSDHDAEFQKVRKDIIKRDGFRCVYCDFKSSKFQEVHHLDGDHANNDMSNLVTTCPLCHMCHHIAYAGIREMGTLIYIEPSLGVSQAEVNSLTRSLWLAEDSKNQEISSMAVEIYFRLFFRSTFIKNALGDANPTGLGNYLMSLDDEDYEKRSGSLNGIYFLPAKSGFQRQYKYWRESFKGVMPGKWKSLAIQSAEKWYNIENDGSKLSKSQLVRRVLEDKNEA